MSPIPVGPSAPSSENFPLVRLVAAPTVGAAVLYDFNLDRDAATGHDGFTLGAPEWTGQPGMTGGRAGYRTVSFTHFVESSVAEYAIELATLSRLLTASDGWLLVQLSQFSRPRWLRTWRSNASELSWEQVHLLAPDRPRGRFAIPVELTCDPWLSGERVTLDLGGISLDPTLGCFARLPAIEGDAPAPASLRIGWTVDSRFAKRDLFAFAPVPADQTAARVWDVGDADAWTAGTDTGAAVADAAFAGGSYRPVSFATQPGMDTRLTGILTGVRPGRYKVLLRAARSDTDTLFAFRFGAVLEFNVQWFDRVPIGWEASPTPHAAWVDLGDVWLPVGVPPISLDAEPTVDLAVGLQVERIAGTGQARLDALMLIPASDEARVLLRDCSSLGLSVGGFEVHDADAEAVYFRQASGQLGTLAPPYLQGGFGRVYPGEANALHLVGQSHPLWSNWLGTPAPDNISEVAQVSVDYAPQWMWPDPTGA